MSYTSEKALEKITESKSFLMFFLFGIHYSSKLFVLFFFCIGSIYLLFLWDIHFFLAVVFPLASTFCLLMLCSLIFKPNKYWMIKREVGKQQGKKEWTIICGTHDNECCRICKIDKKKHYKLSLELNVQA